MQLKCIIVM